MNHDFFLLSILSILYSTLYLLGVFKNQTNPVFVTIKSLVIFGTSSRAIYSEIDLAIAFLFFRYLTRQRLQTYGNLPGHFSVHCFSARTEIPRDSSFLFRIVVAVDLIACKLFFDVPLIFQQLLTRIHTEYTRRIHVEYTRNVT